MSSRPFQLWISLSGGLIHRHTQTEGNEANEGKWYFFVPFICLVFKIPFWPVRWEWNFRAHCRKFCILNSAFPQSVKAGQAFEVFLGYQLFRSVRPSRTFETVS